MGEFELAAALMDEVKYLREQNQKLTETLIELLRPQPKIDFVVPNISNPLQRNSRVPSRVRQELEQADRIRARVEATSPVMGKPDTIEKLEEELDIKSGDQENGSSN